jgi:transaldolase
MKFFLDTADVAEIKELVPTGLVDGVTTNPSLVMKSGRDFREVVAEICALVPGPVSAEVTAVEADQMIAEGKSLAKIASNVTVKLPLTLEGLTACRALTENGVKTNVTLCFSANQALLAAKAGATFVSPFIGRLDDVGAHPRDARNLRQLRFPHGDPCRIDPLAYARQGRRAGRRRRCDSPAGRG